MVKIKIINLIKIGIISLLVGVIYYPAFIWIWKRWNAPESYYSHGPLIIFASLFLVWIKRGEIKRVKFTPDNRGIIIIIAALIIHTIGNLIRLYFISAVSLLILLTGIIFYLFGREMLQKVRFPVLYLVFMIPAPLVLISNIVIKMKLFAGEMGAAMLNKIGLKAIRDGSIIRMQNSYLEIGAPCSGLRSLIALLAFGVAFAYLTRHSNLKKCILVAAAVPIALIANIFRIVLLGWVSEVYGMQAAQGWIHDFSGFLLFAIAGLGLIIVNSLLTMKPDDKINK